LAVTLDNVEFDDQEEVINYAMQKLPIIKLLIDRNGIGLNLAENAEKAWPGKCEGVDFTNTNKTLWATEAKMLIQKKKTPLPPDRDIAYQIHSIKKTITAARNNVFDTARNEKHHADKFWAWVLALWAAKSPVKEVSAW
jgi:phage FluMu gp28-like protein